jgi:hypothetical protein
MATKACIHGLRDTAMQMSAVYALFMERGNSRQKGGASDGCRLLKPPLGKFLIALKCCPWHSSVIVFYR